MFGNIYLNEMDWYIKKELHIKYYSRFMDDSIILVKTKPEAIQALEKIQEFLKKNLHLELNNKTQIFKSSQGVNYCGYKINEYRLKIRDKGKKKLKKKIKYLRYEIKTVLNAEATTTIPVRTIQFQTVTTTIRTIRTATILLEPHSNIISDYIFHGIYTAKY